MEFSPPTTDLDGRRVRSKLSPRAMPTVPGSSGPQPAWYRRLPPALRRIAAASDRVPSLPLRAGPSLRAWVAGWPRALVGGRPGPVRAAAREIAAGFGRALGVAPVAVRVERRRPPLRGGELQGLYESASGRSRPRVTVWMLTAKRGQV